MRPSILQLLFGAAFGGAARVPAVFPSLSRPMVGSKSRYMPHQGRRECDRRRRQMAAGVLK